MSKIKVKISETKYRSFYKTLVTSLSAAALLMKLTHRNMFVYHLYIIVEIARCKVLDRPSLACSFETVSEWFTVGS